MNNKKLQEMLDKHSERPNESKTKERCNCKRLSDSANESKTKANESVGKPNERSV